MKDATNSAPLSLAFGNLFVPCADHRPTCIYDKETGWITIECKKCRTLMILHPKTYQDLLIAMEIDEIEDEINRQK